MRWIPVVVACVAAWCASAAPAQDGPVNLRPLFVSGSATRYEFWARRDEATTTRFGPNEHRIDVRYTFNGQISWRVDSVRADGSADCTMTFDWFAIEVTAEGQSQSADSRKGSGEWEGGQQFVKAIAGQPLTVRVAADGTIEKISGVGAITARLEGEDEDKPDENDFKENAASLAVLWGPPAQLAVGGSWPASFAWNHEFGTLNHRTTYTLNDVGELAGVPAAMVSSTSKLSMDFDDPGLPPDAPPVTMKLDSGQKHEQIIFDLSRRETAARNMTQTLKITQSIRLDQGQLVRVREESVQEQVVRVAEE